MIGESVNPTKDKLCISWREKFQEMRNISTEGFPYCVGSNQNANFMWGH